MQDNKNNKTKKQGKQKEKATLSDFETYPTAGGKKNPKSHTSIPPEDGVKALKSFVEENKK
jgi:hypothetical protein